jgi:hypothetical protein
MIRYFGAARAFLKLRGASSPVEDILQFGCSELQMCSLVNRHKKVKGHPITGHQGPRGGAEE